MKDALRCVHSTCYRDCSKNDLACFYHCHHCQIVDTTHSWAYAGIGSGNLQSCTPTTKRGLSHVSPSCESSHAHRFGFQVYHVISLIFIAKKSLHLLILLWYRLLMVDPHSPTVGVVVSSTGLYNPHLTIYSGAGWTYNYGSPVVATLDLTIIDSHTLLFCLRYFYYEQVITGTGPKSDSWIMVIHKRLLCGGNWMLTRWLLLRSPEVCMHTEAANKQ